jgi:thiamine-monophosphate kinase
VKLRDVGEFGLIERIARRVARSAHAAPAVRLGIGDDAAVLRLRASEELAVSTDAVVEGVHFRWRTARPRTVGRRAFLAAISDLAAMGARPLGFTLALTTPPALSVGTLERCIAGMLAEAEPLGCPLVGGNVTRGPVSSFTLTVLGAVARGRALRRDKARPGDRLFVTGVLGAAALDLARAERGQVRSHRVPTPRLAAGRALARLRGVGACIDLSDGLLADLGHVLDASAVGAALDLAALPTPRGFAGACARLGLDPRRLALTGGEDYELLFTLRPRGPGPTALAGRLGAPVTEIGRIVAGRGVDGLAMRGFTHF